MKIPLPLLRTALFAACSVTAGLSAAVQPGFSESAVATGLTTPSALDIAPDGRIFVVQQNGVIRVIGNDILVDTPFATLAVNSDGERGLLGIAVDPNFASNHYIYVYYTANSPSPHNRLSRLTVNGNNQMLPNSEVALLDLPDLGSAIWHMGGALQFGPDGKLYISVGDHQDSAQSQSLTSLLGKILRLNSDGTIPTDNPFYNQATGINRAIWAYGLRNPFTTAFQPGTGRFFINDVGESNWEEIDDGIAGSNYGWPTTEGTFNQSTYPAFTEPFFTYSHSEGCAITGGAFYSPASNQFGAAYMGKYFYADYCSGWIHVLDPATKSVSEFATNLPFPINLRISTTGALYYVARGVPTGGGDPNGQGSVWKIENPTNQAPAISVQPQSQIIANGTPVTFSVSASGTQPLQYQWQRNSSNISGATASSYTISNVSPSDSGAQFRVIVSNNIGTATSNQASLTVPPGGPPVPVINTPLAGTYYNAGDTISFSGTASDPDQGPLPASALTWQVDFQHDTHAHPFIPATSGITGSSFVIPTDGEKSDNVWYRIYLTATDATGLRTTTQREIFPHKAVMTLATNSVGLNVKLDGQPKGTPASMLGVVGIVRTLEAYVQSLGAVTYDFDSWSDGGAALHSLSFPPNDTTYTAQYQVIKYLSDLSWVGTPSNGWGPVEKDTSNGDSAAGDGLPITIRGVTYPKGIGCHAPSQITYNLAGRYTRFVSDVGVDDETLGQGSVVFQVWTDGVKVFDSGVVTGTSPVQTVNVNVVGKNQLQLVVTNANDGQNDDHSDWAGARLTQPLVTIAATDSNAAETGDPGAFTVIRSGNTTSPLTVTYTVSGSATTGTDYNALSGSVTIPAGAISSQIIVTPIADNVSEGPEQVIVTLTSNGSSTYFLGAPTSATVTIADKPFDSWKFSKFAGNANNSQIACDTCDPINSGLSNLLKYSLNMDPMTGSLTGVPVVDRIAGRLRIQFTRDSQAIDLKYEVQGSDNMVSWSTIATSLNGQVPSGSAFSITETTGRYRTVTVVDNAAPNAAKRFLRLKITRTQ
jgi:glucose/arabinose dehydrogenase